MTQAIRAASVRGDQGSGSGRALLAEAHPVALADADCPAEVAWFVINLDRSPERWAMMAEDLGRLGLGARRVVAIDGSSLSLPEAGVDPDLFLRTHGRTPLPGEIGCYLSHLRALAAFLETDAAYAVILEDDAMVTAEAVSLVAILVADDNPRDWDLVKFEAHHSGACLPIRGLCGGWRLCTIPLRSAGSAAYLIDRPTACRLLERLLPISRPYDIAFERSWDLGLRVRIVAPMPIRTRDVAPTIDRCALANARQRLPWMRRIGVKMLRAASAFHAWLVPTSTLDLRRWASAVRNDPDTRLS